MMKRYMDDEGNYKIPAEDLINRDVIASIIQEAFNLGTKHGYVKRIEYEQTVEFENEMRERFK